MKKIKTLLIHLLGGISQLECEKIVCESNLRVDFMRVESICHYMDIINGTPADDWCKLVYSHITDISDFLSEKLDDAEVDKLSSLACAITNIENVFRKEAENAEA